MTVPVRTAAERSSALSRALEVRRERAALRQALKSGQTSGADVVRNAVRSGEWHDVRVRWLLESLPGIGSARADAIMWRLGIVEGRRLGGLTDGQRHRLLEAIG